MRTVQTESIALHVEVGSDVLYWLELGNLPESCRGNRNLDSFLPIQEL